MIRCPKCGSCRIVGPIYERNAYGVERLRYTCGDCTYSTTTPTLDQLKPEPQESARE